MISKNSFLGTLKSHGDSIRLIYAVRLVIAGGKLTPAFEEVISSKPSPDFNQTLIILRDPNYLTHVSDQVHIRLIKTAVCEAFDLTRDYCKTTSQKDLLEKQPWFQVFRIIRNAFNHNFHMEFNKHDMTFLPLEWEGIHISKDMDKKEINFNLLTLHKALDWLTVVERFINTELR